MNSRRFRRSAPASVPMFERQLSVVAAAVVCQVLEAGRYPPSRCTPEFGRRLELLHDCNGRAVAAVRRMRVRNSCAAHTRLRRLSKSSLGCPPAGRACLMQASLSSTSCKHAGPFTLGSAVGCLRMPRSAASRASMLGAFCPVRTARWFTTAVLRRGCAARVDSSLRA